MPTSLALPIREADNIIVLGPEGHLVDHGGGRDVCFKNSYVQQLASTESNHGEKTKSEQSSISRATSLLPGQTTSKVREETQDVRGNGDWSLYAYYLRSIGLWPLMISVTFCSVPVLFTRLVVGSDISDLLENFKQILILTTEIWLQWWTAAGGGHTTRYLTVYIFLGVGAITSFWMFVTFVYLYFQVSCKTLISVDTSLSLLSPDRREKYTP